MNALFIWPQIPLTYWGAQYTVRLLGKHAVMPPLGLLTVAALCPKEWNLRLVDLNIETLDDSDLEWADIALISGMGIQQASMLEAIKRCNQAGIPTIVGGPDATSSPEKYADVTYLVLDEAEITLPLFLKDFAEGNARHIYTAEGAKPDVTHTPVARFDLLKTDSYSHMCVQFSRGCPFACEFCDITTLYGKNPRTKAPDQIVREFQAIYELGFTGPVFLVDDNFIGNKKNVKLMLPSLITWMKEHNYPFALYTEASLNLADDDELLDLMNQAGFDSVFVGIESPSLESLRETQKYQNIHGDMLSKIHKIQEHGLEVMAGFIIGFDHDKEDIFERQIEFITAGKIPMAMVGTLHAMPSTQLWVRLEKEGRLRKEWTGDNLDLPNFETNLPALTLMRGYRTVLSTLYSPANFFSRLSELIASLKDRRELSISRFSMKTRIKHLVPLVGALLWLTLVDKHRREYWRFMTWVWRNHPDRWFLAICRAVTGYHFIRYTEEVMVPRLTKLEAELEKKQAENMLLERVAS